MKELFPKIYVGGLMTCSRGLQTPAYLPLRLPHVTIHAAKDPCYRAARDNYLSVVDTPYPPTLVAGDSENLFLNMIDPPTPLFRHELFWATIDFIKQHIADTNILIHCNLGQSRSPALALVYAAHAGLLPCDKESVKDCLAHLHTIYPDFQPGKGLEQYLQEYWGELINAERIQAQASQRPQTTET